MIYIFSIIASLIIIVVGFKTIRYDRVKILSIFIGISFLVTTIITGFDIYNQSYSKEVWSGQIIDIKHEEEWDETITETSTDSKGNTTTTTRTEHHDAENYINTTDDGWISVDRSLDGSVRFDDRYPNNKQELSKYYSLGMPTTSVHSYENKVKSSYSIYRHPDIDLNEYKDLPKYPIDLNGITIDRFIGDIDNKENILHKINEVNTDLNSKEKKKQVNLIFINLGDKPEDYGFALQDYWQGGNKNDFVIVYGSYGSELKWVYPFSWADNESSEKLKIEARNYLLEKGNTEEFEDSIDKISEMIERDFKRKEFADFNYINIEVSKSAYIMVIICNILEVIVFIKFADEI